MKPIEALDLTEPQRAFYHTFADELDATIAGQRAGGDTLHIVEGPLAGEVPHCTDLPTGA